VVIFTSRLLYSQENRYHSMDRRLGGLQIRLDVLVKRNIL